MLSDDAVCKTESDHFFRSECSIILKHLEDLFSSEFPATPFEEDVGIIFGTDGQVGGRGAKLDGAVRAVRDHPAVLMEEHRRIAG